MLERLEEAAEYSNTHLLDIIIRYQTRGLFFVFRRRFLFRLPPIVLVALLEDVYKLSLLDSKLVLILRRIIVQRCADGQENHVYWYRMLFPSRVDLLVITRFRTRHLQLID